MKNILAITYWSYKEPLVQAGALPYLRMMSKILPQGSRIFLVCIEKDKYAIARQEKKQIIDYLAQYKITLIRKRFYTFGIMALLSFSFFLIRLLWICLIHRIKFIHAWCTTAGTLGYTLSILTGKSLIIDSYEPHAESMLENGTWDKNSFSFKFLFYMERLQTKKASAVLALTEGMKDYANRKYGAIPQNYFVKPSCIDLTVFKPRNEEANVLIRRRMGLEDKVVCIYVGKFGGIYLTNELFDFFKIAVSFWSEKFKAIIITDITRNEIEELAKKSGVDKDYIISFSNHIAQDEVIDYLSVSDFAVSTVKPVPSKRYCSPLKNGEYWAMGLPVVIPENISDDSDIIEKEHIGAVLPSLNKEEYRIAIEKIEKLIHSKEKKNIKEKIIGVAQKYRDLRNAEKTYISLYS